MLQSLQRFYDVRRGIEGLCLQLQSLCLDLKSLYWHLKSLCLTEVYNKEIYNEFKSFTFYVSAIRFTQSVYKHVSSPAQLSSAARVQSKCTQVQLSPAPPSQLLSTSLGYSYQQVLKLNKLQLTQHLGWL